MPNSNKEVPEDSSKQVLSVRKSNTFMPTRRILAHKNLFNKKIPTSIGELDAQLSIFPDSELAIIIIPEDPAQLENPRDTMYSYPIESIIGWCIRNKVSAIRYNPLIFNTNLDIKRRDTGSRREKNAVKSVNGAVIQANYALDFLLEYLEDEQSQVKKVLAFGYKQGAAVAMNLTLRRPELSHCFVCSPQLKLYDFSSWIYLNRGKQFTITYGQFDKDTPHHVFLDFANLLEEKGIRAKYYVIDTDENMGDCKELLQKLEQTIEEHNLLHDPDQTNI
jgi:predicted esterase